MTRTLPIVFLLTLAAVAPVLAARAIGNLEIQSASAGSCLDTAPVHVAPKAAPKPEAAFCSAAATEVLP